MDKWREENGDYFSEVPFGVDDVMQTYFKNGELIMATRERTVAEQPKKKLTGKGLFKGLKIVKKAEIKSAKVRQEEFEANTLKEVK